MLWFYPTIVAATWTDGVVNTLMLQTISLRLVALTLRGPSGGPPGATAWSFIVSLQHTYSFRGDPPGALRGPLRGAFR